METFLRWWLLIILTIAGYSIGAYFGFFGFLYLNDLTRLSFTILFIFWATTVMIGYKTYQNKISGETYSDFEFEWFTSEAILSIGMIGTVIGFIYMLYSVFDDLDFENVAKLQESMMLMAQGMGTALLTTLVGLISSVIIKFQLMIVENDE